MSPEHIFEQAIDRFERPLTGYAKEITGDWDSARDAVQETFLRLARQDLKTLEPRLAPWLFFVCRNCALDFRRKVVRFSDEPVDDEQPGDSPSPLHEAVASEETRRLRGLVDRLPQQQRELVRMKFEGGLSYKEMAEAMKMSVSHVGVQLHEAIQTLRKLWNTKEVPAP